MALKYIRNWSSKQIPLGKYYRRKKMRRCVRGCMWNAVRDAQEGESIKKRSKYFGSRSSKCVVCKAFTCCVLFVLFGWLARVWRLSAFPFLPRTHSHSHFLFVSFLSCAFLQQMNFLLCMKSLFTLLLYVGHDICQFDLFQMWIHKLIPNSKNVCPVKHLIIEITSHCSKQRSAEHRRIVDFKDA